MTYGVKLRVLTSYVMICKVWICKIFYSNSKNCDVFEINEFDIWISGSKPSLELSLKPMVPTKSGFQHWNRSQRLKRLKKWGQEGKCCIILPNSLELSRILHILWYFLCGIFVRDFLCGIFVRDFCAGFLCGNFCSGVREFGKFAWILDNSGDFGRILNN